MRRYKRTLATVALVVTMVTGTAGWASGNAQQAVTGGPEGVRAWVADGLPDPQRMTPRQIDAFFDELSPAARERLTLRHPAVVGNLDGAPVRLRYAANARSLEGDPRFAGRQVLAYDPRGRGQVAVVEGDLERAEHVAVVVPGSDVDAARSESLLDKAEALYEATGERVAVVAWAGYTTPVGVGWDAATGGLAEAGAGRLVRFAEGLAATGAPEPAVFCHSYGSVVCGLAAHELKARDIVVHGSPGLRADNVAGLHTSARVWAAKDPDDWISKVPNVRLLGLGHGADPTGPGFGARPVPAADAQGHDGYFAPGTQSLRAFAAIAEGDVADGDVIDGGVIEGDVR
ncbi:alpha/beta hydrolase [Streptomyces sp. NPDC048629]|uniref:alpha/beta hydrolase n=1 Tax=Streptomyces sp. NPDC048629 TaxID=3154824 RepID=UPI0034492010